MEVYRTQLKDAGGSIAKALGLPNYVHVGETDMEINRKWCDYICEWRLKAFSTTKLAAWFPLFVLLYWVGILVWLKVR